MVWSTRYYYLLFSLLTTTFSEAFTQPKPVIAEGFPIPLETDRSLWISEGPILADLDLDGRLDIIVSSGRKVYAFQHDGQPLPGWPQATQYVSHKTPAVGDLDGDGSLEVITYDREGFTRKSLLYAWNHAGRLLSGFPVELALGDRVVTLYDLEGDGKLEIVGTFGYGCYIFRHDGTLVSGWPQNVEPYYLASGKAAVGDVNGDGVPEILAAGEDAIRPTLPGNIGRLYLWDISGQLLDGWPVDIPKEYDFFYGCDPTLVDVNNDGFMEIAVGATRVTSRRGFGAAMLYRFDGKMMPGWPQFTAGLDSLDGFSAGPAAADLDSDGDPELIFGDTYDHVIAWNGDGSLVPGWPVFLGEIDSTLVFRTTSSNPTVGDIDNDDHPEIFTDNNQSSLVEGSWFGRFFAFNHDGTNLPWSPLRPRHFALGSVALGDLDNDNVLELITTSGDGYDNEAWLTVWKVPGVRYVKERFPWPMYGHDRWHTSQYGFELPDEPVVSVAERPANSLPQSFVLHQNYPNPFSRAGGTGSRNRFTEIRYELPAPAHVSLRLFNMLGAEVRALALLHKAAGFHRAQWDGKDESGKWLPAGLYFYRLEIETQAQSVVLSKKLVLLE